MSEVRPSSYVPNEIKEERFEFVLYVNNHIICQRFFPIHNFDEELYNPFKSLDLTKKSDYEEYMNNRDHDKEMVISRTLKQLLDNIVGINNGQWGDSGIIPSFLKDKSTNYLWDNNRGVFDAFGNRIIELPISVTNPTGGLAYKDTLEPYLLGKDTLKYGGIYQQSEEQLEKANRKTDTFQFDIKIDKQVVATTKFQNYFYPLSAQNTVKIKDIIPSIMNEIRHFLGKKNYTRQ